MNSRVGLGKEEEEVATTTKSTLDRGRSGRQRSRRQLAIERLVPPSVVGGGGVLFGRAVIVPRMRGAFIALVGVDEADVGDAVGAGSVLGGGPGVFARGGGGGGGCVRGELVFVDGVQ